jgi:arylsulfatase A-like enzyme
MRASTNGCLGGSVGSRLRLPDTDVLPTILNYLELPTLSGVEGEVLDLTKSGPETSARTRFAEASKPPSEESDAGWFNNPKPRCVRQGSFKYIQTRYRDTEELYDLSTDPYEQRNLLASHMPEMVSRAAELRREPATWTAGQNPLLSHFDKQQLDETIARLRTLGYLGGDEEGDFESQGPP